MPWLDRIKEAAYISPSGNRYVFQFENVGVSRTKKTSEFEFPDAEGTYVQESGSSGRSFPLTCYFSGANCDLEATAFDLALFERGIGKLEHPFYGTFDVVPTGTITRRDDLKTAANQAVIEVTFMSTIGLIYPSAQTDPGSQVVTAVEDYNASASSEFESNLGLDTISEIADFKNKFVSLLNQANSGLSSISATVNSVESEYGSIFSSINRSIDLLIGTPLTLAFQTMQLLQAPGRAKSLITDKLNAYKSLSNSIISTRTKNKTDFYNKELYASAYVTGSVVSAVNTKFETKNAAIETATLILDQFDTVNKWKDSNLVDLEVIDTGGAYQQLQKTVALTAGYLVDISFTLKQERRIILDRARTIVDLSAEIYGEVDSKLDFLIDSNDLSGSEILELPKGKEVVYYV